MKFLKTSLIAVSVVSAMSAVQSVQAYEVEASAAVASQYIFRGKDQGAGKAMVSGDVTVSESGAYASTWVASAGGNSSEYDLILGYGGEVAGVSYDVNVTSYNYPQNTGSENPSDSTEAILTLGYGAFEASYADSLNDDANYSSLSASLGKVSGLVGYSNAAQADDDYTHVDLSYQHNDNFSLTLSKVVDQDVESNDDDLNVVISYQLPIK